MDLLAPQARGGKSAMIGHAAQVATLGNRIADALYDRLAQGRHEHVSLVHASPSEAMPFVVEVKRLVPFDFGRFPAAKTALPPLLTLPPQKLSDRSVVEYVFPELCEAIMQSHAAESEKRMRAIVEAQSNVAEKLDELTALSSRLRLEEIASEILELSAGAAATAVGDDWCKPGRGWTLVAASIGSASISKSEASTRQGSLYIGVFAIERFPRKRDRFRDKKSLQ